MALSYLGLDVNTTSTDELKKVADLMLGAKAKTSKASM